MRLALVLAVVLAGCAGGADAETQSLDPRTLVLEPRDLARGYQYGDDTGCGRISGAEGRTGPLVTLFARERPHACRAELEWAWETEPPYAFVESAAFVFRSESTARRTFDLRGELAGTWGSLRAHEQRRVAVGDEAAMLRGDGLNNEASAVVWRTSRVVGMVVVEPHKEDVAMALARKQQLRLEAPPHLDASLFADDPELPLDDPSVESPIYWLGNRFAPPGGLPVLELDLATVGANGPGQTIQLWYGVDDHPDTVNLDTWERATWERFRRTRLGRLIWDSPCARKRVVGVTGGRAEIYLGYSGSRAVQRPCPARERDAVIAHVHYAKVVLTVHLPYGYGSAEQPTRSPYDTVAATETIVRSLRLRERRR